MTIDTRWNFRNEDANSFKNAQNNFFFLYIANKMKLKFLFFLHTDPLKNYVLSTLPF